MSRFSQAFYFYANRVGIEDGKSFAGGSFIYNPAGQLIAKASYTEEEFLIKDINLGEIREIRKKWPYKRDEKPEVVCAALKRIISKDED
jgi:predicted amidohydrolase